MELYTHGHPEVVVETHARRTAEADAAYARDLFFDGAMALDVGCGPGSVSVGLARWVGSGEVIAIDVSEEVLESARRRSGEVRNLRYEKADVYELPYEDSFFDVVHAHQVLQHLAEPVRALSEMMRVLKPGGAVAVRDGDFETFIHHPYDPMLARWRDVYRQVARANGGEPDAGRKLFEWVSRAGFDVEAVTGTPWIFTSEADRIWWGEQWALRAVSSPFADRGCETGITNAEELEEISHAWKRWTRAPYAYHSLLMTEVVGKRPQA